MDNIKYIKCLYEKEALSIREIMRKTGYHYETVRKYLDMEDFNEPMYPPKASTSLLDPLKLIIDEWLLDDLKALGESFQSETDGAGFDFYAGAWDRKL